VVKSTGKMYWGHKASTISFARQEILLDAVAMTDAASHDSQSLPAHVARVFKLPLDDQGFLLEAHIKLRPEHGTRMTFMLGG